MDPQGSLSRGPARGVHGGKQVFSVCMRVAWSLTITPLRLFYGKIWAQCSSPPPFFWLTWLRSSGWVFKYLPAMPVKELLQFPLWANRRACDFPCPSTLFSAVSCEESFPGDHAVKSLRQQLDFIRWKLRELVKSLYNRSVEFHYVFSLYAKWDSDC